MAKKIYPLQEEIQKALIESASINAKFPSEIDGKEVAEKYFKAITRINQICVDRKRY